MTTREGLHVEDPAVTSSLESVPLVSHPTTRRECRSISTVDGIDVSRRTGPIWTTAALLAEGVAEIDAWYRTGYLAVDMETASTFAVAEHYGLRRLSVLVVFDNPREGAHLALTEDDKAEARIRGEAAMRRLVLACLETEASVHHRSQTGRPR